MANIERISAKIRVYDPLARWLTFDVCKPLPDTIKDMEAIYGKSFVCRLARNSIKVCIQAEIRMAARRGLRGQALQDRIDKMIPHKE